MVLANTGLAKTSTEVKLNQELRVVAIRGVGHSILDDLPSSACMLQYNVGCAIIKVAPLQYSTLSNARDSVKDLCLAWEKLKAEVDSKKIPELSTAREVYYQLAYEASIIETRLESMTDPKFNEAGKYIADGLVEARNVRRIAQSQYDLLTDVKRSEFFDKKPVATFLKDVTECLQAKNRSKIKISTSFDGSVTSVTLHVPLIQRAIGECFSNVVRLAEVTQSKNATFNIRIEPHISGCSIILEDNIGGFPAEFLEVRQPSSESIPNLKRQHAFDPDALTKGGGVGLNELYLIARAHGGWSMIENITTGDVKGSRIKIYLP